VSSPAGGDAGDVRVLVVDDQQLIRDGIASLLSLEPGMAVVGTAADGADAVSLALELSPDVVLMDVRMPGMDGVAALAALRAKGCEAAVIMLTTFDDDEYVTGAMAAGANGYLLKDLPPADLATAVRGASTRVTTFDAAIVRRLTEIRPSPGGVSAGAAGVAGVTAGELGLTPRELDVVRMVVRGATNREIAQTLFLGEGTVKNHVSRVLGRLGLRDRTQLAVRARDLGLG
jgi:DNA-binding NarL/FixJ family response regulator